MMQQHEGHPHHNTRFYIIMTTLVVAGIFFLLLMNSDSNFSLTGSTVGIFDNESSTEELAAEDNDGLFYEEPEANVEKIISEELASNVNEIGTKLTFSRIPSVKKDAKVKEIVLGFDDLSAKVNVNDDRLELSNLKEVTLIIKEFKGQLDFDKDDFSLDGTARGIEVNGVSLSSKSQIKISFDRLNYQYLNIEDIQIKELSLENGDGTLTTGDKLNYALEQDDVKLYNFDGKILISKVNDIAVEVEGVTSGVGVSGALMNFNVR